MTNDKPFAITNLLGEEVWVTRSRIDNTIDIIPKAMGTLEPNEFSIGIAMLDDDTRAPQWIEAEFLKTYEQAFDEMVWGSKQGGKNTQFQGILQAAKEGRQPRLQRDSGQNVAITNAGIVDSAILRRDLEAEELKRVQPESIANLFRSGGRGLRQRP